MNDIYRCTFVFPLEMVAEAIASGRVRVLGEDGQPMSGDPRALARELARRGAPGEVTPPGRLGR